MTDSKVPVQPLKKRDLSDALGGTRLHYAVELPSHVPYAAVFTTEYWSEVAKDHLRPGFLIDVTPTDQTWFAQLYVRDASDTGAVVAELFRRDFEGASTMAELDEYEAEHIDNVGWCVVNKRTGKREAEGLKTKQAAAGWIASRKGR
jgi:hypothetical protein